MNKANLNKHDAQHCPNHTRLRQARSGLPLAAIRESAIEHLQIIEHKKNIMATISEIIEHPELATKEDFEALTKTRELGKSLEGYNVNLNTNNTTSVISSRFYQEHFVMSAVLEAFYNKDVLNYQELNEAILNRIPKEFLYNLQPKEFQNIILKMKRLGFLENLKSENEYMPIFKITDDGIKALQQQTFQNLSSSSFFNYQTQELNKQSQELNKYALKLNKRAIRMNIFMLIVTIMSVLVTFLTIFF